MRFQQLFKLFALLLFVVIGCSAQLETDSSEATDAGSAPDPTAALLHVPDLTGETIALYHLCGRAGPLAEYNQTKILAVQDMVGAINKSGGIFGAQLLLEFVDTGGSENAARSAYDRIVRLNDGILLFLICDANTELTIEALLAEDQIPALGPGFAPVDVYQTDESYLFAYNTPVEAQFAYFVDYINHNWTTLAPPGSETSPRWALLAWPDVAGGQLADAEWIENLGVELAFHTTLAPGNVPDLFDTIYETRDENVNLVYITARGELSAALLDALGVLGLKERVLVAGPSFSFESELSPFLFDSSNAQGAMFTSSAILWMDGSASGVAQAQKIFTDSQRDLENRDRAYLSMLGAVDIAQRVIESAILEVGFENLDAVAVFEALAALDNYEVLDGLYSIDYSSGDHYPQFLQLVAFGASAEEESVLQAFSPIPTLSE